MGRPAGTVCGMWAALIVFVLAPAALAVGVLALASVRIPWLVVAPTLVVLAAIGLATAAILREIRRR